MRSALQRPRQQQSIQLPSSIVDEVEKIQYSGADNYLKRRKWQPSRKEKRKAERMQVKSRRAAYTAKKAEYRSESMTKENSAKVQQIHEKNKDSVAVVESPKLESVPSQKPTKKVSSKTLQKSSKSTPLLFEEEEDPLEDEALSRYAKKLKLNKKKSLPQSFAEDGLDDLLLGLDDDDANDNIDDYSLDSGSDDDDDEESDFESDKSSAPSEDSDSESSDQESDQVTENEPKEPKRNTNEALGIGEAAKFSSNNGNVYVPPHLRQNSNPNHTLNASVQGQLNRLNDSNLASIVSALVLLTDRHARALVTEAVVSGLMQRVQQKVKIDSRSVMNFSALVSILFSIHSVDLGAVLIEKLVFLLNSDDDEESVTFNAISFLAHLCLFQVLGKRLLMDLLLEMDFNQERKVEQCLNLIQICGQELRRFDPILWKQFIVKMNDCNVISARFRYLKETLLGLCHNKRTAQDSVFTEMKSTLSQNIKQILAKYATSPRTTLCPSLEDVRQVATRGKWWLIGAVWEGNKEKSNANISSNATMDQNNDQVLSKAVCKLFGLNTPLRRALFVAISQSTHVLDAQQRVLVLLGQSPASAERDVAKLLVDLCCRESQSSAFNPFYACLTEKLCSVRRGMRMTLQFILWDYLKDEDEKFMVSSVAGCARYFAYLVQVSSLPLSILKNIQFEQLNQRSVLWLQVFFASLLSVQDESNPIKDRFMAGQSANETETGLSPFKHLALQENLKMLQQGIVYFLYQFVRPEKKSVLPWLTDAQWELVREQSRQVKRLLESSL